MFVALAVIATLMYASYRDLPTREIPEVVWLPAYLIAIAGVLIRFLGGYYASLEAFLSLMPALVCLILFLVGLLGGADFLALLLVTIAHLHEFLIPLLTFVISSLIPVPLILLTSCREHH